MPGGYDAQYEPIAIDGDLVVAHGRTRFFDPLTGATQAEYDNIWVLRFGPDGRCAEFHAWYARRPDDARRAGQLRGAERAKSRKSSRAALSRTLSMRGSSSRPTQPPAIGGMTCTRSPSRSGAPRTAVAPLTTKM